MKANQKLIYCCALILSILCVTSCQKDADFDPAVHSSSINQSSGKQSVIRDGNNEPSDDPMVLGNQLNNPFSVANMTLAYNRLYEPDVVSLPPTHLYVRFKIDDQDEYELLEDELEVVLFDHPLDYEILAEGSWYHDPTVPEEELTWQYAVVETDFQFPQHITHEVLEEIVRVPYFSVLAMYAFSLTGNEWEGGNWKVIPCTEDCDSWPECDEPCLESSDTGGNDGGTPPPTTPGQMPPCHPSDPNYPDCYEDMNLANDEGSPGIVNPTPVNTDCGCTIFDYHYRPSGCIQLDDTQFTQHEGVSRVLVNGWHWFHIEQVETTEQGCFQFLETFGKVRLRVKFKNDKVVVRGVRNWKIWEYALAIKDFVDKFEPPLGNIHVLYGAPAAGDIHSKAAHYWVAANFMNATREYYEFATEDGIGLPPDDLDVLISPWGSGKASAPMLTEIDLVDLELGDANAIEAILGSTIAVAPLTVPLLILEGILYIWRPDITFSYNGALVSDKIKRKIYHELAHTSHFAQVGDDYWEEEINYTIANGGYGDGTAEGAGRAAIVEAWGYHIGPTYADRRYGLEHSNTTFTDLDIIEQKRHINQLESSRFVNGFIPKGLILDLIDDNFDLNTYPTAGAFENGNVTHDSVKGYTNASIFNHLTSDTESPEELKNKLTTGTLPTAVTTTQIVDLFSDYNY